MSNNSPPSPSVYSFGCGHEDFVHCIQLITYSKKLRSAKLKLENDQGNSQQPNNHPYLQFHQYTNPPIAEPFAFSPLTCVQVTPNALSTDVNIQLSTRELHTLLKRSIVLLSTYSGYDLASPESLKTLTLVTESFIKKVTQLLTDAIQNYNLKDFYTDQVSELFKILNEVGFSVASLMHYSASIKKRKQTLLNSIENEFNVKVIVPSNVKRMDNSNFNLDQSRYYSDLDVINVSSNNIKTLEDDSFNGEANGNLATGSVGSLTTSTTPLASSLTSTAASVAAGTEFTNFTLPQGTSCSSSSSTSNGKLITTQSSTTSGSSSSHNIWDKSLEEIQMLTDTEILDFESS